MKLNFNHRGVKLFFITFAVAGRAKVLSKLVDEKSRPELTALGEAVYSAQPGAGALQPTRVTARGSVVLLPPTFFGIIPLNCPVWGQMMCS